MRFSLPFAILDMHNCSRLASGVHNPAILQEMVYKPFILSLFLTERFPHQQVRSIAVTFFTNETWKAIKMFVMYMYIHNKHGFLVRVCSLSLRFCQEPVPQGSGLQLCMARASIP